MMADALLMAPKRNDIDFHRVLPQHEEIHRRLINWSRWCNGTGSPSVSPMFRLYRSEARARGAEASWSSNPVDGMDARRIAGFMKVLPEKQRKAVSWCYVKPISPRRMAAELEVSLEHLACLVHEARAQLLILGA